MLNVSCRNHKMCECWLDELKVKLTKAIARREYFYFDVKLCSTAVKRCHINDIDILLTLTVSEHLGFWADCKLHYGWGFKLTRQQSHPE